MASAKHVISVDPEAGERPYLIRIDRHPEAAARWRQSNQSYDIHVYGRIASIKRMVTHWGGDDWKFVVNDVGEREMEYLPRTVRVYAVDFETMTINEVDLESL